LMLTDLSGSSPAERIRRPPAKTQDNNVACQITAQPLNRYGGQPTQRRAKARLPSKVVSSEISNLGSQSMAANIDALLSHRPPRARGPELGGLFCHDRPEVVTFSISQQTPHSRRHVCLTGRSWTPVLRPRRHPIRSPSPRVADGSDHRGRYLRP
jgi:hypothetical protein